MSLQFFALVLYFSFRRDIRVTFSTYCSLHLRPGHQFVVVIHRPHPFKQSVSCRRSFDLQDRANLVSEYIFLAFEIDSQDFFWRCNHINVLFKDSQCFEAIFLTPRIEICSFEVRNVFVMKSSCVLNWASFGTDMFLGSSKEIYHSLLQQTRKFLASEFAHIIKIWNKKKTLVKIIKTPSGLGAKLHERYVWLDSMHTHRLRPQTVSQKVTSPIAAKLICVFSIAGSMFRSISSQTRTVKSIQRHY